MKPLDLNISDLQAAISSSCKFHNSLDTEYFVEKVIHLNEMLNTHTGVIIIGDSSSGKTTIYRILATALGIFENANEANCCEPIYSVINPKSITMSQLYGVYDNASKEWKDGILAINFKAMNSLSDDRKKWLIFDGTVDSIWMNNIHSLLDDNRRLCLMSGDMLQLRGSMNLIFEPLNLLDASPSIVSTLSQFWKKKGEWILLISSYLGFTLWNSVHVIGKTWMASIAAFVET